VKQSGSPAGLFTSALKYVNSVPRRIFGPRGEEGKKAGENYVA
jgi:hypothetical protein